MTPASDLTPVLLLIKAQLYLKKNRPTITPSTTNWNKFKNIISNKITLNNILKSITDINQAIAKVSDDIQKVAKTSSIQTPESIIFLNTKIYQQN